MFRLGSWPPLKLITLTKSMISQKGKEQGGFFSAYRRISADFPQIFYPPEISSNLGRKQTNMQGGMPFISAQNCPKMVKNSRFQPRKFIARIHPEEVVVSPFTCLHSCIRKGLRYTSRNFTPSCSWDYEADCQKNVVCQMCRSMFAKFTHHDSSRFFAFHFRAQASVRYNGFNIPVWCLFGGLSGAKNTSMFTHILSVSYIKAGQKNIVVSYNPTDPCPKPFRVRVDDSSKLLSKFFSGRKNFPPTDRPKNFQNVI